MMAANYLIIGNSAAGIGAAESIRAVDKAGTVVMITWEEFTNYSKPLITYYLAGKIPLERVYYRSAEFYEKNAIELVTGTKITGIDTKKREAYCSRGNIFSYRKLLIASGGEPIIPPIEVSGGGRLDRQMGSIGGVFTLTTIGDACSIRDYINKSRIEEVTVLGGGLIGLKAAEACYELGLRVNMIELSDRILPATFDRRASEIMEARIGEKAGRIYTSNTIKKILKKDGSVKKLVLADGTEIDCSLLIVAVGVRPNTSFIGSEIAADKGIKVGRGMETTAADVFAAGDAASTMDILGKKDANIAIWPLAVVQGRVAGANMAGSKQEYGGGFFMNSVQLMGIPSISMGLSGVPEGEGEFEVLSQVDPASHSYRKVVISNNRIVGLIMLGNIERAGIYAGLIKNSIDIGNIKGHIIKEDFGLIQLPSEYKKHLVVGEGIEV
ncbi:MAG: NAD(P)/FAD-dependent oxidoreductase [Actinomycetota bacterium]